MEERINNIKKLLAELNMWKDNYSIKLNPKHSGQSITFFIEENNEKVFIAKYFDYLQGIDEYILESINAEVDSIDMLENILADTSVNEDVEQILECIYISRRSFKRYVDVCSNVKELFPKLYGSKDNIKIGKRFYGLLIEEFVKGNSLSEEIKRVNRSEIDIYNYAKDFFIKISETIRRYSENGFVHRDISPDNIILSNNGPIIIDPGFIKILSQNSTKMGYMLGKIYYASPEQYNGKAVNVDFTSDLYSIAIIIYEIITGTNLLYKYIKIEKSDAPHNEIVKNLDRCIEDEFFEFIDEENENGILLYNILKKMLQVDRNLRFNDINSYIDAVSLLKGGK